MSFLGQKSHQNDDRSIETHFENCLKFYFRQKMNEYLYDMILYNSYFMHSHFRCSKKAKIYLNLFILPIESPWIQFFLFMYSAHSAQFQINLFIFCSANFLTPITRQGGWILQLQMDFWFRWISTIGPEPNATPLKLFVILEIKFNVLKWYLS